MAYTAALIRVLVLQLQTSNIQSQMTKYSQEKLQISGRISDLVSQISELDADDATVKQLNAQKAQLESMEKMIDQKIKLYETKLTAATQEQQQAEKMLAENIPRSVPKYTGLASG